MSDFTLILCGTAGHERIGGVTSFVGEDATGSFGIRAGHARFLTSLVFGLARFRRGEDPWQFLALPRALAYFADNELILCTRRYLIDSDYSRISALLTEQLLAEEESQRGFRAHLDRMEEAVLRRLWKAGRERGRGS
jgi:F-type H+-transporting ATPase subunit epsilon